MKSLLRFLCADDGLETIEYAVMGGLIVAGTVASVVTIGTWMGTRMAALEAALGA